MTTMEVSVKAILFLAFLLLAQHQTAVAQDAPHEAARGPVMKVGMTVVNIDFNSATLNDLPQRLWQWDATLGLSSRFGMGIDIGYSRPDTPKGAPHSILSYAVGPVWYPVIHRSAQPYVHGFAGLTKVGGSGGLNAENYEEGHLKLAWKVGTGVDIPVIGPIAMRIGLDYLRSEYVNPLPKVRGQNSLRAIAGLQYIIGRSRRR